MLDIFIGLACLGTMGWIGAWVLTALMYILIFVWFIALVASIIWGIRYFIEETRNRDDGSEE